MEASGSKLQAKLCPTKSPRGSKQQQQRVFLPPRCVFQATQGKSRCWNLVDQVDEFNVKIEELLRTGEATISESTFDDPPVSKKPHTENEEGESLNKSSEEASWEDLDLAADSVIRSLSLGLQLSASTATFNTELSNFSRSNSTSSPSSEGEAECEFDLAVKRLSSNDSRSTGLSTRSSTLDEEAEVEVKTLDCLEDDQLSVSKPCIGGHDLMPHRAPSNMWWCSKCGKQVERGTRLFGCRICNYDECWSCLRAAQAKVKGRFDSATNSPSSEVLLEEVAFLQQQMSITRDQLHGVTQQLDVESARNRGFQVAIAKRLWRAFWSELCNDNSDVPAPQWPVSSLRLSNLIVQGSLSPRVVQGSFSPRVYRRITC